MPAFYHRPTHLTDIIDHTVSRIADLLAIDIARPWAPPDRQARSGINPLIGPRIVRFPDCPRTDLVEARRPGHVGPRCGQAIGTRCPKVIGTRPGASIAAPSLLGAGLSGRVRVCAGRRRVNLERPRDDVSTVRRAMG